MVAIDPAPFDLSLATVTCELPPCLERTEPPWLTYTECTSQTERIFPWTAGSGWTTEPRTAAVPKTREAGKEKARIIAGHRTFLPDGEGFEEYILGVWAQKRQPSTLKSTGKASSLTSSPRNMGLAAMHKHMLLARSVRRTSW